MWCNWGSPHTLQVFLTFFGPKRQRFFISLIERFIAFLVGGQISDFLNSDHNMIIQRFHWIYNENLSNCAFISLGTEHSWCFWLNSHGGICNKSCGRFLEMSNLVFHSIIQFWAENVVKLQWANWLYVSLHLATF